GEEAQAALRDLVPLALPPARSALPGVLPREFQLDEQGVELPLDESVVPAFRVQQHKQVGQAQMWVANQQGQDAFLLPGEGQVQQRGDAQAVDFLPVEFFGEHRRDACAIYSPRWLYLAPRLLLQRLTDVARKPLRAA